MASIADVFFKALLEDRQLQIDAVTAGDKAGETLGTRMSKGISGAMRVGLGVIGAATGFATKGLVELDGITRKFAADTGASAEEAKAAGDAILAMSRRNLAPLGEIGDALTKVHTDMGLTGKQAEDTTEAFLKFSEVTHRNAAEEVAAFDDILDAWGKTAEDATGIMDQLVASHQKFGGAIADDEAALKLMAPQLKALNLGLDDGIALLNLFKTAGIDASIAPRALTTALTKLNGESLPDFITELSKIQDPTRRAQRAIEVFGTRAGPQLANAIKPGTSSLSDFAITAEEAAGTTKQAADVIEGSITNQIQLAVKNLGGAVLQAAQDFSPLLLALTSLGSLAGAAGLGKFTEKIVKAFASAGSDAADAFINAIQVGVGAAGTIIGNLIADFLNPASALGGNRFALALKAGAAKAGVLWAAAFSAAAKVADLIIDLFVSLPGAARLRAVILAGAIQIGTLWGSTAGKAAGVAFAVAIPLLVAEAASALQPELQKISVMIHDAIFGSAKGFDPSTLPWPLGPRESDWSRWVKERLPADMRDSFSDVFGIIPDEANKAIADLPERLAKDDIVLQIPVKVKFGPPIPQGDPNIDTSILRRQMLAAGALLADAFLSPWEHMPIAQKLVGMGHELRLSAANMTLDIAAGLRSGRANIDSALKQLREDMQNKLSPKKEIALRIGQLFSKTLVRGLHSIDPLVRKQAEGTRALIEDQLIQTVLAGGTAGKKIQEELEKQMHAKDPNVRNQAKRTKSLIDAALKARSEGKTPGNAIGDLLASDLGSKGPLIGRTAFNLGRDIYRNLLAGVTGGSPVPSGGGGGAKRRAGGGPVVAGQPYIVGEYRPELFVPNTSGTVLPEVPTMGGMSQSIGPITVNVDARGATNPAAVGRAVRQGIADAMAETLRTQTARLPVAVRS